MKKISFILALTLLICMLTASCGGTYMPGTTTESGYSSDWLGLEFVPTENMIMASADEIEEMMNLTPDEKQNIDWSQVIEAYEMMATDTVTLDSVVVMAEKLNDTNNTVKKFIETLKSEFAAVSDVQISYGETREEVIAGEKYTRFEYKISIMEQTYRQIMFLRRVGDRMAVITVTSSSEAGEEAFLACFAAK